MMEYKRFWILPSQVLAAKLKRKKIRKKRMRDALDPNNDATLEDVLKLVPLDGLKFMNNIKICFPVFIQLVSEGRTMTSIAKLFEMKRHQLRNLLWRNPQLKDEYFRAKKIARDMRAERIKLD